MTRIKSILLTFCTFFLLAASSALAAALDGDLILPFGAGSVRTKFDSGPDTFYAVAVLPDGKIIAAGSAYTPAALTGGWGMKDDKSVEIWVRAIRHD